MARHRSLGLALGGGAARGLAHLGVLRVLEAEGLRPDFVAGTSAGSIVGALYAGGYTSQEIADIARSLDWGDFIQPVLPRMGLVRADKLEKRLDELLDGRTFDELELSFRAVAVDLVQGEVHVIDSGPVARAVRASCSIPGIFEPVLLDGRTLVDGGVLLDVPVPVCREMGARTVVGVNLNADLIRDKPPENMFQVLLYSFSVMVANSRSDRTTRSDARREIRIEPDLRGFSHFDMNRMDELIERGESAAREKVGDLRRIAGHASR